MHKPLIYHLTRHFVLARVIFQFFFFLFVRGERSVGFVALLKTLVRGLICAVFKCATKRAGLIVNNLFEIILKKKL